MVGAAGTAWRSAGHGNKCRLPLKSLALLAAASLGGSMPLLAMAGADFGSAVVSEDARTVAEWVAATRDNAGVGFLIIDKKAARLHVFDERARHRSSTPVLLGAAIGDHTVPGIGLKPVAEVLPHERTTPAGRFIAERGRNAKGKDIVWVDYDAAVSMHRVVSDVPAERRLQRLASPTVADNRISYGCINIPVKFYESSIRPMFAEYRAVVYILPEKQSLQQVFGIPARSAASTRTSAR
jgi:hypothetical protein